jgi:predicted SAM-dependent methyltransferase
MLEELRTMLDQASSTPAVVRPTMLNVGCGTDYKPGWVNIDNNSDNNITRLDLNWDFTNPLPYPNGSVDFIFNEHLVEHLTVEESRAALTDFLRVLRPGGVLRVAMPDLQLAIDKYLHLPIEEDASMATFGLEFVQTRAERLNMAFRWWGHRWLYDWEELARRLYEVGCRPDQFVRAKLGESIHPELRNLETRAESILIVEVTR